jgi:CRISPR/Cas system CSM-associated protein Csm3 (group 7 of RAMP superfamily)
MNPYDFVPLDTRYPPEKRPPIWHNILAPNNTFPHRLYSGHLYLYIKAETPLFIQDSTSSTQDPDYPGQSLRNYWNDYIIPGSSLKGLLRTVVETLCRGCMTVFRVPREYTHNPLPPSFSACQQHTNLCVACRLFGMMRSSRQTTNVFLGKVNIGDALPYEEEPRFAPSFYTAVLDAPKPRHRAFYLDEQQCFIAGRKFYFHHTGEPRSVDQLIPIRNPGTQHRNQPPDKNRYRNQHIEPLAPGTDFSARIDFTNLEADEFAALLFAITLQPDMRHKIGYGKPLGLGSVQLAATNLQLVDFGARYTSLYHGGKGGITSYGAEALTELLTQHMAPLDQRIQAEWERFSALPALQHLHHIWQWDPATLVEYAYPSQSWFKTHPQARIRETRNLAPGE